MAVANRVGGDFDWNKSGKIVHVSKFRFKAAEMGIRAFVMKPKDCYTYSGSLNTAMIHIKFGYRWVTTDITDHR
jgi:hypothetical protein